MNETIPSFDCSKRVRKRYKTYKPYWNDHLEALWKDMRQKERAFTKYTQNNYVKRNLLCRFKVARNTFDKVLRNTERAYRRDLSIDIETACTDDPRKFWDHLRSLGPKRKQDTPFEVYDEQGNVTLDPDIVCEKWSTDFSSLYNQRDTEAQFDNQFYDEILKHKRLLEENMLDPLYEENTSLNHTINRNEVEHAVFRAKNGKASGIDKIPYEVLKNQSIVDTLHSLFNLCFDTGIIPSIWRKAIISPLPKDLTKDKRLPLNYRGISLLSVVSKLYSSVLNRRLLNYLESEDMLVDEQNGFRPDRSCEDHVYTACTVIRNRMLNKQSTFATFIDLQKAFDFVDRDALLYRLISNGIDGKFYNSIKAMFLNTTSCVKLNGTLNSWFPVSSGVRQGDSISPTIFAFFINDLAEGLKRLHKGVNFNNHEICCLLYADDIMLMSESEEDLQIMLDFVHEWRLRINYAKSNVMHFRNKGKDCSSFNFHIGNQMVDYTNVYRYLGIHMHENLDFSETAEVLSQAGGRALGAMISKIHGFKDVGYNTYTKMFNSCVVPVTDYCSGIWGFKQFNKIDTLQNRAIRYFLGVHRFTPILAINGEMGWTLSIHRRWVNMIRLWNRLISMDDNRLTKCVFNSDYTATGKTWCSDLKNLLHQVNMQHSFENKQIVNLEHVKNLFNNKHQQEWNEKLQTVSKLRTYVTFKSNYETETYLKLNICKAERSHLAQFRCAVLPLKIETGRFLGLNVEDRLCQVCDQNAVENEIHFLLHCTLYDDLRRAMIVKSERRDIGFRTLTETEKLTFILKHEERQCAKLIFSAMHRRKSVLYR